MDEKEPSGAVGRPVERSLVLVVHSGSHAASRPGARSPTKARAPCACSPAQLRRSASAFGLHRRRPTRTRVQAKAELPAGRHNGWTVERRAASRDWREAGRCRLGPRHPLCRRRDTQLGASRDDRDRSRAAAAPRRTRLLRSPDAALFARTLGFRRIRKRASPGSQSKSTSRRAHRWSVPVAKHDESCGWAAGGLRLHQSRRSGGRFVREEAVGCRWPPGRRLLGERVERRARRRDRRRSPAPPIRPHRSRLTAIATGPASGEPGLRLMGVASGLERPILVSSSSTASIGGAISPRVVDRLVAAGALTCTSPGNTATPMGAHAEVGIGRHGEAASRAVYGQ